jgi:hypothetical protein
MHAATWYSTVYLPFCYLRIIRLKICLQFIWVWNLRSHIKGKMYTKGVQNRVLLKIFGSNRDAVRLEKTALGYHLGHQIEIQVGGGTCHVWRNVYRVAVGNRPLWHKWVNNI